MWRTYGEDLQFFVVYIREAHALDSFLPKGGGEDPVLEDPTTYGERLDTAQTCMTRLALDPMPALVDTIDDQASRAYDAWPDRMFLIGRDGRVAYQGARGPDGFSPDELEAAIRVELGLESVAGDPRDPGSDLAGDEETLVRFGDRMVPERDLWKARRGYLQREDGLWTRIAVPESPVSAGQPDRFRCGDAWLDEEDANDFHSRLLRWWKLPSEHFVTYSTCDRQTSEFALEWMEFCHRDLVRIFGVEPREPATVILCRSLVQYNLFAITAPDGEEDVPPELAGRSAFYHAFPCESWLDVSAGGEFPGAAAAYWDDKTAAGNSWGPFAVRHAAGQAFVEAIDPSPEAVAVYRQDPERRFRSDAFWAEKQIPLWLRYGASTYVERFFVEPNSNDPQWARRWSLGELKAGGGVGDLDAVFRFDLDQNAIARSRELILRSGSLVAFVLDGGVPEVERAHQRLRRALSTGRGVRAAATALEAELRRHAAAIDRFVDEG